jgi:putative ABC transport system permease protein
MSAKENILVAFNALKSNRLRAALTALIIAIGIAALVGILTSIDALESGLTSSFSDLGSNTFTIQSAPQVRGGGGPRRRRRSIYPNITYEQARNFKQRFEFPCTIGINNMIMGSATIKHQTQKTNPNVVLIATDEAYLTNGGLDIEQGRNFLPNEITNAANVALVGSEVVKNLNKTPQNIVNQVIIIGSGKYRVVGTVQSKGSSMQGSSDNFVAIPASNARRTYPQADASYSILITVADPNLLNKAVEEAGGGFRSIRRLRVTDPDNFTITKSDAFAKDLLENLSYIRSAGIFIGIITLLGAAIGLMNIMLVSVTERTREIGTLKALGATQGNIRRQFLLEAILIGQIGGAAGIILGILMGYGVGSAVGVVFSIPWLWIMVGVSTCAIVGIVAGYYPAVKAAQLDPIEALRYE